MNPEFETFVPDRPPEEMLARIHRRFRRRQALQTGVGATLALALAGLLIWRPWAPLPATPSGHLPLVREVRHLDRPAPYTLLRLKSGATVVIIHTPEEDKS